MGRGPIKNQALATLVARNVPVATVIDVGVLHGTPELMEAFPDCEHILFEPVTEHLETIRKAYAHIRHRLVHAAVSDRSGTTGLGTTTIIPGVAISHSWMTPEGSRRVPMVSLDDYLRANDCATPIFLKIDIDGAEMEVLAGAKETLRRVAAVMVEVTVVDLVARIRFLEEAGFRVFDLAEPCYYDGALWNLDAIMLRNDVHAAHFSHIHRDFDLAKYELFRG